MVHQGLPNPNLLMGGSQDNHLDLYNQVVKIGEGLLEQKLLFLEVGLPNESNILLEKCIVKITL
jgi:hypothetical protein